ncbi:MAG: DNA-binding protein [Spirochaetales bacterium]|nr:DNA-binding protein [Spirochaetales bacterium]
MKIYREASSLVIVMRHDERFSDCMRGIAALPDFSSGVVVTGLGMVRNAELGYGYYDGSSVRYDRHLVPEPAELVGLSGLVLASSEYPFHVLAVLGGLEGRSWAGHLFDAEVHTFVELVLQPLSLQLGRKTVDGLPELGVW